MSSIDFPHHSQRSYLSKIKLINTVYSYLLCGKKKSKNPKSSFKGGRIKKEWLLLNHEGCKGDKTPISPTNKQETSKKMENTHEMERPEKGLWYCDTFSLKHASSSLDFQSHFRFCAHNLLLHTPPLFWPFCLITFCSSQRAAENEKTDHETMKAVSCIYYQVYRKNSISCQI